YLPHWGYHDGLAKVTGLLSAVMDHGLHVFLGVEDIVIEHKNVPSGNLSYAYESGSVFKAVIAVQDFDFTVIQKLRSAIVIVQHDLHGVHLGHDRGHCNPEDILPLRD